MKTFKQLLKEIRKSADVTQKELAKILGVSWILIAKIEDGEKEVSKKFIENLAKKMGVHPISLSPFIFSDKRKVSEFEKRLIEIGEELQKILIEQKSKNLK